MILITTTILVMLIPGMISCTIFTWLREESYQPWQFIFCSLIFDFLIALFTFGVMLLMGQGSTPLDELFVYVSSTVKYGVVAFVSAVTFPVVLSLISKIKLGKQK